MRSCVSGGGCRPVTPGEGGACGAGRRQRGSGQAAARAAQSPGVERRGRGETYTGPPGPAQCRRRGLHGFLRRAGPSPCAPLCSKLLWRPERNCRRRALCGGGAERGWRPHAGGPRRLEAARSLPSVPRPGDPRQALLESWGLRYPEVRRRRWRSGWASRALPASWNCPKPQPSAGARRGGAAGLASEKAQRKVWLFTSSSRSPRGVRPQRQREMAPPGRWLTRGSLLLAGLGRVWVPRSE